MNLIVKEVVNICYLFQRQKKIHVLGLDCASERKAILSCIFKASDLYTVDIYNGMS